MEAPTAKLIIATTPEIEGRSVREYLGIVGGDAAMTLQSAPLRSKRMTGPARSRAATFERRVQAARERAIAAMADAALQLGATAIIAAEIRCTTVRRPAGGDLLIVSASGTAVDI